MTVKHFRELIVWQKAMDLVADVYRATELFPKTEVFGLVNQMRRCAVSVPSNIAEGQGRATTKDFMHFLHMARGSLQELETQIAIAHRLNFIPAEAEAALMSSLTEVAKVLAGLLRSLSSSTNH